MMRIGLIDVDGHNYPNLPLMKISAWHKAQGDRVEWYEPLSAAFNPYDKVYMSKVFSFTPDYQYPIYANEIEKGGSGYCISYVNGKEQYDKSKDKDLPYEIEHIYPDYSLYPDMTKDTAYGFLTRGCPRGCSFCHVKAKEGLISRKVADLDEFWRGQKNIELLDPNILACKESEDLLHQLINSKAKVNFNQGLDIRLMTDKKAELISQIPINAIHFAWDRYEDKEMIQPKFLTFRQKSTIHPHALQVYVLCGDQERRVRDEDLERVYWLRDNGYAPYIMLYNKKSLPKGHELLRLQRWVNNRFIFWKTNTFDEYLKGKE
ncbi:MAG: radical SAM protein [Bacteroidales bacterium]|nr:radical SAM protein [Bacteroidales bacterium]